MTSTHNEILTLATLGIELTLVTNTYESYYTAYTNNIKKGNYEEARKILAETIRINDKIIEIATKGKNTINTAITLTIDYHSPDVIPLAYLDGILLDHNSKKIMLANDELKITKLDGPADISQQNYQIDYLQYIIIIIVGLVVAGLTSKTMITQDESNLELAILAIIAGLIVYFLITNLII